MNYSKTTNNFFTNKVVRILFFHILVDLLPTVGQSQEKV